MGKRMPRLDVGMTQSIVAAGLENAMSAVALLGQFSFKPAPCNRSRVAPSHGNPDAIRIERLAHAQTLLVLAGPCQPPTRWQVSNPHVHSVAHASSWTYLLVCPCGVISCTDSACPCRPLPAAKPSGKFQTSSDWKASARTVSDTACLCRPLPAANPGGSLPVDHDMRNRSVLSTKCVDKCCENARKLSQCIQQPERKLILFIKSGFYLCKTRKCKGTGQR